MRDKYRNKNVNEAVNNILTSCITILRINDNDDSKEKFDLILKQNGIIGENVGRIGDLANVAEYLRGYE